MLFEDKEPKQAFVYDIYNEILYEGYKNFGAFKNGEQLKVSKPISLDKAIIATGFPYDRNEFSSDYIPTFEAVLKNTGGEIDVRATYCILTPCHLLGLLDKEEEKDHLLSPSIAQYIASCRTFEDTNTNTNTNIAGATSSQPSSKPSLSPSASGAQSSTPLLNPSVSSGAGKGKDAVNIAGAGKDAVNVNSAGIVNGMLALAVTSAAAAIFF